jgi:hypothetical protein
MVLGLGFHVVGLKQGPVAFPPLIVNQCLSSRCDRFDSTEKRKKERMLGSTLSSINVCLRAAAMP